MKEIRKLENLVIGGNLSSLEFAFREGFPIFYEKLEIPFHLETTKDGLSRKDVIQNYAFLLALAGLNLSNSFVSEHRVENNKLIITGKTPWIYEYQFNNLYDFTIFNDTKKKYKVIDYINVRSCGSHDLRELKTKSNFVKEIYFYPSQRANSSKGFSLSTHNYETIVKDVIIVSYLNKKEIEQEEYSPIYSRLRLKEIMEEVGIRGKKCGTRNNGKVIHASIKLEFAKREVVEIEQQRNYYYTESKNSYLNKLFKYLYGRKNS